MKLTLDFIRNVFDEYNNNIFEVDYNRLPTPRFRISNAKGTFGVFSHRRNDHDGYSYVIRISKYFERDEHDFRMTILHEMIHEYIAFNSLSDDSSHGWRFRTIMNDINAKYGTTVNVCGGKHGDVRTKKRSHLVLFTDASNRDWAVKTTSYDVIRLIFSSRTWSNIREVDTYSSVIDLQLRGCRSTRHLHGYPLTTEIRNEIFNNLVA